MCDAIVLAAEGVKKSIDDGSTINFVQGALILSSAVGFLSSAAAMVMETSMNEVQDAMKKAGESMVDDVMNYLKKEGKNDKHE